MPADVGLSSRYILNAVIVAWRCGDFIGHMHAFLAY